jgi:hypothetical protein
MIYRFQRLIFESPDLLVRPKLPHFISLNYKGAKEEQRRQASLSVKEEEQKYFI